MIFFKKKNKKSTIEDKKPLFSTPSLKQQQETHTYDKRSSDSLLQFNLLDDFSSTIDIPQLLQQEDKSVVDTCSSNHHTSIYSESTIDKVNTTRDIQPSFNSTASYTTLPVSTSVTPEQKETTTKKESDESKETTKNESNESKETRIDIKHDESLNVDSLTDPEEGDIKLSDNRIIPLLLTKENSVTLKEEQDDFAMYSNTLFDDENNGDKKDIAIELPSDTSSTLHCVMDDSPTLPPTLVTEDIAKLTITDELNLKETTPKLDHTLELRSETEVHSLEISSLHEIQSEEETINEKDESFLVSDRNSCDVSLLNDGEEEYTTTVVSNNDEKIQEEKKQDVIGKRRSAHSFIPRKQNINAMNTTEDVPPIIKKLPTPSTSTNKEFNVNRRGSSGSSIPVPQQNRLSFTMIEKHWSPSSSSDSLSIKSPNSIHSNTSVDSVTSKVIKPHNRLSSTNSNQTTSKIPIFATKQQPDIPKAVSSITNTSRLPVKRTPTTAV